MSTFTYYVYFEYYYICGIIIIYIYTSTFLVVKKPVQKFLNLHESHKIIIIYRIIINSVLNIITNSNIVLIVVLVTIFIV